MTAGNGSKPATQADIKRLDGKINEVKDELKSDIKRLDGKIDEVKDELKSDIKRLDGKIDEVKDELKSDIKRLDGKIDEVKAELKSDIGKLAVEIVKTNGLIDDLRQGLDKKFSQNTDRILTHLDKHAKIAEANNRAVVIHGQALTEQQRVLNNHEGRLASLESKS